VNDAKTYQNSAGLFAIRSIFQAEYISSRENDGAETVETRGIFDLISRAGKSYAVYLTVEQLDVPFAINVPMLHRVGNIGCLDDCLQRVEETKTLMRWDGSFMPNAFLVQTNDQRTVLNHNAASKGISFVVINHSRFTGGKGLLPTILAHVVQILIKDVCGKDNIDKNGSEAPHLLVRSEEGVANILKPVLHEQVPGQVKTVLFCHRLVPVLFSQLRFFFRKLYVGNTTVVD